MLPTLLALLIACGSAPPDTGTPPTSGSFRVLSYNVAGLPTGIASVERPTPDRMERIAPLLAEFDWAGLQEDFTDEGHGLLLAEADHPVEEWFDALVAPDRFYGSGLTVLARGAQPVALAEEHYDACYGTLDNASDCLASKGFQVQTLSVGGAEIDFYNTHHEAGGGTEDEAARTVQVGQVVASLEGRSAGRAVVYTGDFNMRWSDPPDAIELDRYVGAGLRDSCLEVDCPEPDRIDHVWVRDGDGIALTVSDWTVETGFVDEDGAELSDHEPIAVTVHWELD